MSTTADSATPQNIIAEKSVLGAVLLDEQHLHALLVDEQLRPEHFYVPLHAAVFQAMLDLYEADQKIDHLTVAERLRQNGRLESFGGPGVVEELVGWVPASGHARDYGRIVREQAQMRALLDATQEIRTGVLGRVAPPRELLEQAERAMLEVAHDERQKSIRAISDILQEETDRLHHRSNQKSPLTGTPAGFHDLDNLTGGFQRGNLIILAARPAMGKSALVANIAENAALAGYPVAMFSLEMSESELAQRFVASQARVPGEDLRRGKVAESRWPKILEASGKLSEAPLFVDDSSDTGVLEVRAKSRRLHHQLAERGGLGLIIIDYLQLMRHEGRIESRVEQVGQISRSLKTLARELNVPVIALSQLSRNVEQRAGEKRPVLSDLRECVPGDTPVLLADGSRVTVANLVGTTPEVLSVDAHQRVIRARSDAVWSVGRRPILKVTLASGRVFRGTSKHRVLTDQGWPTIGELQPGDRFALARHLPEPPSPDHWAPDRVVLLGHLIGRGSYRYGTPVSYQTTFNDNRLALQRAATREFGASVSSFQGPGNLARLLISDHDGPNSPAGVRAWLEELGILGQDPAHKRLPARLFALCNEQIALFVRHLWAAGGLIRAREAVAGSVNASLSYPTASPALAADLAALLLRLGIVACINPAGQAGNGAVEVAVSGRDEQRLFLEKVGAFGHQAGPAARLLETLPAQPGHRSTRPSGALGQVQAAGLAGLQAASPGHGTWAAGHECAGTALAQRAQLQDVCQSRPSVGAEIFWDRVQSVASDGEADVYDLTVPGPACWLADGLVTHNSGQIEQDADLVMFIYREEYYNAESTRPGEADIIIAKHRNGPVGEVTLTFQSQYPKFMNYASPQFAG
ncbi:MAG: replicative DNA helicase [Solirubrobacteraceae bacterium]